MTRRSSRTQPGFVAIITVLFFTILVSVLTIGFLRIMTDQREQVVEDDLSKGALAAAESGVEDAKRLLQHCRSLPMPAQANCYHTIETATSCPGVFGGASAFVSTLSLTKVPSEDAIQIGDSALNQKTTCTLINFKTADVVGRARDGLGEMVPLLTTSNFNHVKVEWHNFADDGSAVMPALATVSNNNPVASAWKAGSTPYPAMLRVSLIVFHGGQTLNNLTDQYTTFLVPTDASVGAAGVLPGANRQLIHCATGGTYACTADISVPAFDPASNDEYFMLVSSVYGQPHYRMTLSDGAAPVAFVDAQPSVDVTGAAGDVYRRVSARVVYKIDAFYTHNAIEAGGAVCKDFSVTIGGANSASGCLSLP